MAGAITAALLAAECSADQVRRMLDKTEYWKFADYGLGGKFIAGPINALFRLRGLVPGKYFSEWMADRLEESPLGKRLGRELTFGDLQRTDLSGDLDPRQYEKARYKLRVIASDVTAGRMLLLPDDIEGYAETKEGAGYSKNGLPVVLAELRRHGSPPPLRGGPPLTAA